MKCIKVTDLIKGLRLNNQTEMLTFFSDKVGKIYWCNKCNKMNPEKRKSFWDGKLKCTKCSSVLEECKLEDFI